MNCPNCQKEINQENGMHNPIIIDSRVIAGYCDNCNPANKARDEEIEKYDETN